MGIVRILKKAPELLPLGFFIGSAMTGACSFMAYSLAYKPDVWVVRSSGIPPWEHVRPDEKRKLFIHQPNLYTIQPEVEQLRKEIGSYKV